MLSNTSSNTTASGPGLTLETLRKAIEMVESVPRVPRIEMLQSVHAIEKAGRVKTYPKGKAKSASHWRRMDKKWAKRYGYRYKPSAYWLQMPDESVRRLIVHPALYQKYRTAFDVAHAVCPNCRQPYCMCGLGLRR
jgi:hypothetical protein